RGPDPGSRSRPRSRGAPGGLLMRASTRRLLPAALALGLVGCRGLLGLDGLDFDQSGGSEGPDAGPPPAEDCENGVDDDGDGLVDCADPDCAKLGYQCVAAVPSGWT